MGPVDDLRCKACKRYVGLWSRDGELVGLEYHRARVEEVSATMIGWGSSGLGMWSVKRAWVCDWPSLYGA
jgi:hypothetical protein